MNHPLPVLLVSIVVLALVCCRAADQQALTVSLEEARQAARTERVQQAQTGFPSWAEATLGQQYTFYDLEQTPSAYMFICQKQGNVVGYITVSASRRFMPIFESSTADTPPVTNVEEARALAEDHTAAETVRHQLIFLGGLSYYASYETEAGQQVFVDLTFPGLRIVDSGAMQRKQHSFERAGARNAREAWEALLTPTKS